MIIVAYLIFILLLIWIIFGSRGKWFLKIGITLFTILFSLIFWMTLESYKGWPIKAQPPQNALFIAGIVDEPDPHTGDPGHIDLWLIPLGSPTNPLAYSPSGQPRAYLLPYTKQTEQQVQQAQALQKGGQKGQVNNIVLHRQSNGKFHVFRFPPPHLPPKQHQN